MADENFTMPLQSIYNTPEMTIPTEIFTQQSNIINEALRNIGSLPTEKPEVPDYFDDMLRQLIDDIPLE